MDNDPIVIVGAARTPQGNMLGCLSPLAAHQLGSVAIQAAVERSQVNAADIEEVIMGCVLPAGQGQAPARQAAIGAGLPVSTGALTINKMCGSGMKAVMLAHDMILAGNHEVMLAGGMESMSNAPHLLAKSRRGYRLGNAVLHDHMFLDGLEDAYDKGKLMGCFAEDSAEHYNISREDQDEFAKKSLLRAQKASKSGAFQSEIAPVTVKTKTSETIIDSDEGPISARVEDIPTLKTAFKNNGTITAANSSSISDGAAALILMRQSTAEQKELKPLARIVTHATHSQEPNWFTTAPVDAIKKLYKKTGWSDETVDLYEINEAFAVVTLIAMQELNLPHDKVNIHGGACALGHPVGASGARLIVTLLHALQQNNLQRGIAALCLGGGEATAIGIERL